MVLFLHFTAIKNQHESEAEQKSKFNYENSSAKKLENTLFHLRLLLVVVVKYGLVFKSNKENSYYDGVLKIYHPYQKGIPK